MIPMILRVTVLEAATMGRQSNDQASLLDEFRPEDRIPKDHLRRRVIVFVTPVLCDWRQLLASPDPTQRERNDLRMKHPALWPFACA
jgi:hypothetical protein